MPGRPLRSHRHAAGSLDLLPGVSLVAEVLAVGRGVGAVTPAAVGLPIEEDVEVVVATVGHPPHILPFHQVVPAVVEAFLSEIGALAGLPVHVHRVGGRGIATARARVGELGHERHAAVVGGVGSEGEVGRGRIPVEREVRRGPREHEGVGAVAATVRAGAVEVHHALVTEDGAVLAGRHGDGA